MSTHATTARRPHAEKDSCGRDQSSLSGLLDDPDSLTYAILGTDPDAQDSRGMAYRRTFGVTDGGGQVLGR